MTANVIKLAEKLGSFRVRCDRISDSCGWGVPLYEFKGHRSQLVAWAKNKGADGVTQYQQTMNITSLDGLPGVAVRVEEDK